MLFIALAEDKANSLEVRLSNRESHIEYVTSQPDMLAQAGPLLNEATGDPTGTVLIVEAESIAEAKSYVSGDPYIEAGLFDGYKVYAWNKTIG
jgi:uncharacterized protein